MLGNACPSHYSPMTFIFTHPHGVLALSRNKKVTKLSLPHDLMLFLHFSMPKICFLCCWANGKKGAMILGFEKSVFGTVRKLGASLMFFCIFPILSKLGILFLGCR